MKNAHFGSQGAITIILLLILASLIVIHSQSTAADPTRKEPLIPAVTVRELTLVDAAGRVRARLFVGEDGPMFELLDEREKRRASIALINELPEFCLNTRDGASMFCVRAEASEKFSLRMKSRSGKKDSLLSADRLEFSEKGERRIELSLDDRSLLRLDSKEGLGRFEVSVLPDGPSCLSTSFKNRKRFRVGADDSMTWLGLYDASEKRACSLSAPVDGGAALSLQGKGKSFLALTCLPSGSSALEIADETNRSQLILGVVGPANQVPRQLGITLHEGAGVDYNWPERIESGKRDQPRDENRTNPR